MRFKIRASSDTFGGQETLEKYPFLKSYKSKSLNCALDEVTIEISSLSELIQIQQSVGRGVILNEFDGSYELEIYDDYRE